MKATLLFSIATAVLGTSALLHAADTSAASKRIDDLLVKGLAKHKLTPNAPVDEATFLRRTYLTVIGRIPLRRRPGSFSIQKIAPSALSLSTPCSIPKAMCTTLSTTGPTCSARKAKAWVTAPLRRIT
jgi:hypothetical protein